MTNLPASTTTKNNSLLNINPSNQSVSNSLLEIALQSLYGKLQQGEIVGTIALFEDAEPPQTLKEENKLLLEKVIVLTDHI